MSNGLKPYKSGLHQEILCTLNSSGTFYCVCVGFTEIAHTNKALAWQTDNWNLWLTFMPPWSGTSGSKLIELKVISNWIASAVLSDYLSLFSFSSNYELLINTSIAWWNLFTFFLFFFSCQDELNVRGPVEIWKWLVTGLGRPQLIIKIRVIWIFHYGKSYQ